jgi:hypothetical protein
MKRTVRIIAVLGTYAAILTAGHWIGNWLAGIVGADLSLEGNTHARHLAIMGLVLYAALMAMPFMPGMEISLALLAAFGGQIAPYVYAATIIALAVSFLIGRLVSLRVIAIGLRTVGLQRAEKLAPLDREQRLEMLIAQAPKRFIPTLLRHRYLAIAITFNVPGNAIIGGGGGIALLAGASGLFTFPRFLLALAIAVMPVPLTVMIIGL